MTTVAAIDCGTNTLRLLIARPVVDDAGAIVDLEAVDRATHFVRLGQGIDATGEFHPEALARTFEACDDIAGRIREHGVQRARFVATSAARDARNRHEFFAGVHQRLGLDPEVVDGAEEAELSYAGATRGLPADTAEPILVVDIGGGSTEFVLAASGQILHRTSLDIGAVRLTERLLTGDPIAPGDWQAASDLVDRQLDTVGVDFATVRTWLGVAGTHTSLAAIHLELEAYDRDRVHHTVLPRAAVLALAERFAASTAQQRAQIPVLPPRRADVIAAGSLIAARVGARVGVDLQVSESDILDGIALGLLG